MKITINWSERDISAATILKISLNSKSTKDDMIELLASSPKKIEEIEISDDILDKLHKISEVGALEIWDNKGKWFITIKWLTDITDWFIGHTLPIPGKGKTFKEAFNDFYDNLVQCPDRVVEDEEWYTDFSYDENKKKFIPDHKTVRKNRYEEQCKDQLTLIKKHAGFTPYILKEEEWYSAHAIVLYMDKEWNESLTWTGKTPKDALDNMIQQMHEKKVYLVNGPEVREIKM